MKNDNRKPTTNDVGIPVSNDEYSLNKITSTRRIL